MITFEQAAEQAKAMVIGEGGELEVQYWFETITHSPACETLMRAIMRTKAKFGTPTLSPEILCLMVGIVIGQKLERDGG